MNKSTELIELLNRTFNDFKIDNAEKAELFAEFSSLTREERAFVRNRAFDLMKTHSRESGDAPPFQWLEQVIKSLDNSAPSRAQTNVFFSPGDDCRNALLDLIQASTKNLKICVFTISDNRLRDALLDAHRRGVAVEIVTDNEKTEDIGSDIEMLGRQGIDVRIDNSRHHMHHKFAISDDKKMVTGSFNWTMSASKYNQENLVLLEDEYLIERFGKEFDRLWQKFA